MNLAACRLLPTRPLTGLWYRAIRPMYLISALSTAHTRTLPGRYNAASAAHPGPEIIYLAADHFVGLFEVDAVLGSPLPGGTVIPNPHAAWTIINVEIVLSRVVDLNLPSNVRLLQTSFQELTGDWRGYRYRPQVPALRGPQWTNVPTQRLGHALFRVRALEGFLAPSARDPTKSNLMIFPDKLRSGSFVRFRDPQSGFEHVIR
jgi:RES domain-containing protein